MAKLNVALVTPERQVARVEVDMVTAPSVMGEVGILPDHQPLLASLEEGPVRLRAGANTEIYAVSGGFLEVDRNRVSILAETAEHTSEIDEELVSGMAAAMLGVGERISAELMGSSVEQTYVRSEKGYVVLNAVGGDSVLVVLTTKEAKLGLVFIELKRRCADLAKII